MRAVIFGGTTEGRELSQALAAEGADVIVSVATHVGTEEQGAADGITISEGLKDEAGMRELIRGADVVIDATHPYAVVVTENIRLAAEKEGVERLRVVRAESGFGSTAKGGFGSTAESEAGSTKDAAPETGTDGADDVPADAAWAGIHIAADAEDAAEKALQIAGPKGRVLLTTGSKDLATYASVIDPEQLVARVLPLVQSIELCEKAQIPHRNIVAVQGPFSEELNRAVIRDYEAKVMITKESGRAGGFLEKIRACEACGIPAIVIARPQEDGLSYDEVLAVCREKLK